MRSLKHESRKLHRTKFAHSIVEEIRLNSFRTLFRIKEKGRTGNRTTKIINIDRTTKIINIDRTTKIININRTTKIINITWRYM